jgi:hypothetical protein
MPYNKPLHLFEWIINVLLIVLTENDGYRGACIRHDDATSRIGAAQFVLSNFCDIGQAT